MNLGAAFAETAAKHPQKTAVFWGDTEFSFGLFNEASSRLASRLVATDRVKPGDRVALWLRNRPEFVTALFGVLKAGAVVVPINNFLKPDEVLYMLNDADIDVVISEAEREAELKGMKQSRESLRTWVVEELDQLPEASAALPQPKADDLAVIIYTSGTTGHPKGAMLSHGNLLTNVESCRQVLSAVDADRFVVLLPMFHSFMLCVGVMLPMIIGGSMVLIKSLHPAKNIIRDILQREATILPAIPQFFRSITAVGDSVALPLRVCISGGAPLPVEILREFNEKMPFPLIEGYGLSEASPVVSMNPLAGPWKSGSIGVPVPDVEVTIQDEAGKELPVGEIGELCVRGGNVMQGYWNKPEETAATLVNNWLRTGDIGYADEDGYFFITDRKKDMLLVNGINVYPREIEEILYQFPGVKEAAVVGISDKRKGEQPIAFVALDENVAPDEKGMMAFLREKLADYKIPRRIEFLPALPRNATGKILKTALRERLQS